MTPKMTQTTLIGNPDLQAYDIEEDLKRYIEAAINRRLDFFKPDIPCLKLWHLNGSENRKNKDQYLFTFYECNEPSDFEVKLSRGQDHTFFSSNYSRDAFFERGASNTSFLPLGFDPDFFPTNKKYLEGVTHFGLMGKFENRKHTAKIIEVNDLLNSLDIDLTGLSGGEGWNLPAFNATALGKWGVVLNATSHKDWATPTNSILVEPSGSMPVYDGVFFNEGTPFNNGTFYTWTEEEAIAAMEKAESKVGQVNTEGQKLAGEFTYSRTVDLILSTIFEETGRIICN